MTSRDRLTVDHLRAVALMTKAGVDWLTIAQWIEVGLGIFLEVLPFLLPLLMAGYLADQIVEYVPRAMAAAKAGKPIPVE